MTGVAQNGHKCLILIAVPLLRIESIQQRWGIKIERYI